EGHHRMEQAQRGLEQTSEIGASVTGLCFVRDVFEVQTWLDQFQVPVAELAPEKIVDTIRGFVEAVGFEGVVHFRGHAIKAREDPTVFKSVESKGRNAGLCGRDFAGKSARGTFQSVYIHEHESGGVP